MHSNVIRLDSKNDKETLHRIMMDLEEDGDMSAAAPVAKKSDAARDLEVATQMSWNPIIFGLLGTAMWVSGTWMIVRALQIWLNIK